MQEVKIDLYISDLLYQYDCVIVPDFGGFVANYATAEIKPIQHKFIPPSKHISFNKNLRNNDGLLTNHIAQRQSISYDEAKGLVSAFVNRSIEGLNQGDRIFIQDVGTLYLDPEENIQFEAVEENDYLLESFGMNAFRVQPIQRKSKAKAIEESVEKVIPLILKNKEEEKKKKVFWPAAAIFFFLLSLSLFINQGSHNNQLQFSNLKFWDNEPLTYQEHKTDLKTLEKVDSEYNALKFPDELSLYEGTNALYVDGVLKEEIPIEEDNTEVVMDYLPKTLRFHVMGGCFSNASNAQGLVKDLQSEGYEARLLGDYKNLHAVSYQSFATREEAVQLLEKVKNYHNPHAWLLVKEF